MHCEHTTLIPAPVASVWRLTTDITAWPTFMPTVQRVERLDSGPLRVGSSARIKQPAQTPAVWTVTRLEPMREFTWQTRRMGLRMTGRHLLEPVTGGTRNTLIIDGQDGELNTVAAVPHGNRLDDAQPPAGPDGGAQNENRRRSHPGLEFLTTGPSRARSPIRAGSDGPDHPDRTGGRVKPTSLSTVTENSGWVDISCPSWWAWFVRVGGHELSDASVRSVE